MLWRREGGAEPATSPPHRLRLSQCWSRRALGRAALHPLSSQVNVNSYSVISALEKEITILSLVKSVVVVVIIRTEGRL